MRWLIFPSSSAIFRFVIFNQNADVGKTKHQARETTSQSDADDGQNRKPLAFQRWQRVPIKLFVSLKRCRIESRQVPTPIAKRDRNWTCELLVGDVEGGEVDEKVQLLGNGAGGEVGREVEGLEVGAVGEEGGDGAAEGEEK
ncbi:hypothetical protein ACFX1X_017565 [Malus domestica]